MPFPFDKYPWLNFQELNLAYFIKHFREIFEQWNTLLNEMHEWKDATDAELEEWKSTVEAGISSWETGLRQSMEDWKNQTEADISTWEAATLAALDAWKTATTAVFEQIRTEAAASAQAAAGSASAAETAKTAAQTAQTAAEAAASRVENDLIQIETNATDIHNITTLIDDNFIIAQNSPQNLPITGTGYADITLSESGKVFNGNGNFIDLFGIDDGSYSKNGIDITISNHGSRFTINGTANGQTTIKLSDGTNIGSSTDPREYDIPFAPVKIARKIISGTASGAGANIYMRGVSSTNYKGISIRTGGEIANFEIEDVSECRQLYLSFTSGATFDNLVFDLSCCYDYAWMEPDTEIFDNVTSLSFIKSKGCITSNVAGTAEKVIYFNAPAYMDEQEKYRKSLKCTVYKTEDIIYMYIPTSNNKHLLEYHFQKVDDPSKNAYGWRMVYCWLCNPDKSHVGYIVYTSEWETAIKITGRSDFIGLGNHGDQIQTLFKCWVDGVEITESETFPEREFTEIQLLCKLTNYDPADSTTIIGSNTRLTTVNGPARTITLQNCVDFTNENPLNIHMGYLAMAGIARRNNSVQVSNYFIDDQDYVYTDCTDTAFIPDNTGNGVGETKNKTTKYTFWGDAYDLHGYMQLIKRVAPDRFTQTNYVDDAASYNKIYWSMCFNQDVVSGDHWELVTEFHLDSGMPSD